MGDEVRRCEDDLVGDEVLVFQVVEGSLLLDREDVAVPVQKTVVEGVDTSVSLDQTYELVLSNHAHRTVPCRALILPFRLGDSRNLGDTGGNRRRGRNEKGII